MDTKSTVSNRKHTLLHYLVDLLEKQFPSIVGFHNQLAHVDDGAKVGIPNIRSALVTIRDQLKGLKILLEEMEAEAGNPTSAPIVHKRTSGSNSYGVKFTETMGVFYKETLSIYESLDDKFKKAEKDFEKAVSFYGEDPKSMTPEEFFGIFSKFCASYLTAKQENEAALAKEISDRKREEAKRDQEEARKKKKEEAPRQTNKEGGLDDLISSIRTGKAFGNTDTSSGNRVRRAAAQPSKTIKKTGYESDKSMFQNQEQGVVGRLRHNHDKAGAPGSPSSKPKSELQHLLQKDNMKKIKEDQKSVENPQSKLKGSGKLTETPNDVRNRFEQASKNAP
jgi:hypothetical protein